MLEYKASQSCFLKLRSHLKPRKTLCHFRFFQSALVLPLSYHRQRRTCSLSYALRALVSLLAFIHHWTLPELSDQFCWQCTKRKMTELLFCWQDCFPKAGGEQHCQFQQFCLRVQVGHRRCWVKQDNLFLSHLCAFNWRPPLILGLDRITSSTLSVFICWCIYRWKA